jgi:hypothetical protein
LVEAFFNSYGLRGADLREATSTASSALAFMPSDMSELAPLVTFDNATGILSTASLRAAVMAKTGESAYKAAFNPSAYSGAEDGYFTASEIGVNGFSTFSATQENVESIFYGTMVNCLKAIDFTEINEIMGFIQNNGAALASGSTATIEKFLDVMIDIFKDSTTQPVIPDNQMVEYIVASTSGLVGIMGLNQTSSLFEGGLMGFLG